MIINQPVLIGKRNSPGLMTYSGANVDTSIFHGLGPIKDDESIKKDNP
jgi:hypothetical protein